MKYVNRLQSCGYVFYLHNFRFQAVVLEVSYQLPGLSIRGVFVWVIPQEELIAQVSISEADGRQKKIGPCDAQYARAFLQSFILTGQYHANCPRRSRQVGLEYPSLGQGYFYVSIGNGSKASLYRYIHIHGPFSDGGFRRCGNRNWV